MSAAPHPLTAVEVEALRQMRTRLAKAPASDAAAATLGRAALQVLARSGVAAGQAQAGTPPSPADFAGRAETADLAELSTLAGILRGRIESGRVGEWRAWMSAGALGAVIGRRLQLAGRERVEPRA